MTLILSSPLSKVDQSYTLIDRYERATGRVFLNGVQALVRLLIDQARSDQAQGLNTRGLVSGYRGSPLGGVDQELWRQKSLLETHGIHFEPGLNEDLAATMLWGTQQLDAYPGKSVEGVFTLWYGKGPGVDRTGDVFRNANILGTSRHGGALAIAGDDHAAQSSMFPHQTDHVFEGVMMPLLFPASVEEYLSFGLFGYALSRFSGLWVGFKAITETVESGRSIDISRSRGDFQMPLDFEAPSHGLNYDPRLPWPTQRAELERRLVEERLPAALAFARANGIDRSILRPASPRIGFITVGKAHLDLMDALNALNLPLARLEELGVGIYKVGMTWPLETAGIQRFCNGMRAVLVVEEKRPFVESQVKEALFNLPADQRPMVEGKTSASGEPLVPSLLELSVESVAKAIARFLTGHQIAHVEIPWESAKAAHEAVPDLLTRKPYFCSGCPHNTSTRLPEGSMAAAGIGCHVMAITTEGQTRTFCQMGGEGVQWVGMSRFTKRPHLFVNLGDGTYQHSGILAIRQAVVAGTNITYKILFNDAVAMTGGQPTEGGLTVDQIVRQVAAEGVRQIAIVTQNPFLYDNEVKLPSNALRPAALNSIPGRPNVPMRIQVHHRDELDAVQRQFREVEGTTVIVYDQTCAAEERRRRKRGKSPKPAERVFINEKVCEGCGDCSAQSNCISIEPVETHDGRKRRINQSACNTDLSCLKGLCPSFVSVRGVAPRKPEQAVEEGTEAKLFAALPAAPMCRIDDIPYRILIAGIGGTGVVTISGILSMAAHLEGFSVSSLDFTGLAQKNGAVVSHVQIGTPSTDVGSVRVPTSSADLLLGCDAVVSSSPDVRSRLRSGRAAVVLNSAMTPTADFVKNGDLVIDLQAHWRVLEALASPSAAFLIDAQRLATGLLGDAIATNLFMVGYASQKGLLPISEDAILQAILLNGAAVELNTRAFKWGRVAAHDLDLLITLIEGKPNDEPFDLGVFIAARAAELTAYQNQAYGNRYQALVRRVQEAEAKVEGAIGALSEAVAKSYFKVLAYKDEYEVARLYSGPAFTDLLSGQFTGNAKLTFHMAPPLLSKIDPNTGRRRKIAINGTLLLPFLKILARGKFLRGTPFDPFGRQQDRRLERALIAEYEDDLELILRSYSAATYEHAVELAWLPGTVKGFGIVKEHAYVGMQDKRLELRNILNSPRPAMHNAS